MKLLLIAALSLYQRACGCVAADSCCNRGITAARTLPFLAALGALRTIQGDCSHEHPWR